MSQLKTFSVLVIDSDPNTRELLRTVIKGIPGASLIAETDSPLYGYELIRQNRPKVVFLELSGDSSRSLEMASKVSAFFKETTIIGSGPEYLLQGLPVGGMTEADASLATLKACMQAGIRDYLVRPLTTDTIKGVFEKYRLAIAADDETGDRTGRIISVFSNKGGLGKTTIAVNLALALSEIVKQPVALVDLNFQLGDVTTFLDVEPKQTIVDIARNIARVDAAYLESSLAQFSTDRGKVYVLADPLNVEDAEELTADQINAVLTVLRASFEYVVVDTTASFDSKTLCALDLSDQIMMVSIVNLPSIRSSQRLLSLFSRLGYPIEKIKLVLNRYMPDEEITPEDVTETLEHPIFWKIPNNYRVVMASINRGIPIQQIENGQAMHEQFLGLARMVSGALGGYNQEGKEAGPQDSSKTASKSIIGALLRKMNH